MAKRETHHGLTAGQRIRFCVPLAGAQAQDKPHWWIKSEGRCDAASLVAEREKVPEFADPDALAKLTDAKIDTSQGAATIVYPYPDSGKNLVVVYLPSREDCERAVVHHDDAPTPVPVAAPKPGPVATPPATEPANQCWANDAVTMECKYVPPPPPTPSWALQRPNLIGGAPHWTMLLHDWSKATNDDDSCVDAEAFAKRNNDPNFADPYKLAEEHNAEIVPEYWGAKATGVSLSWMTPGKSWVAYYAA